MHGRKSQLDALAVASLVACCFLWGLNQVAAKAALPEVGALWQAALRSSGATLLLWLWSRGRGIALFDRGGTLAGAQATGEQPVRSPDRDGADLVLDPVVVCRQIAVI